MADKLLPSLCTIYIQAAEAMCWIIHVSPHVFDFCFASVAIVTSLTFAFVVFVSHCCCMPRSVVMMEIDFD